MAEALRDYDTIRQKLQALKRRETNPPQDFQKWESFYIQHLSPLSFLLATFPVRVERMEVTIPSPASDRLGQAANLCHLLSKSFSEFYRQALPLWETGEGKRPRMVEDLPSQSFWKGIIPEGTQKIFVLMDGMRWDMWEYMKEKFLGQMADQLRIVQEGALWAHLPSSTPRQLEFLEPALEKMIPDDRRKDGRIWKIAGIDERVHTERGTLEHLFGNVLQYLQLDLAPRLRELPPQTMLIFFSDHGFIENPRFEKADKYKTSRYTHGEDSPFEIIVPWAIIKKIP